MFATGSHHVLTVRGILKSRSIQLELDTLMAVVGGGGGAEEPAISKSAYIVWPG